MVSHHVTVPIPLLISYLYFLFAELRWPHKEGAIHPKPIRFHVVDYESYAYIIWPIQEGFHKVGIMDNCIIGIIIEGILFPFVAPGVGLHHVHERIKVHIHGDIANEIEPLLDNDPINDRFFNKGGPGPGVHIRWAKRV